MLVTSVLQPVFAGDYVAGKTGNLTLTVQQADEEGTQDVYKRQHYEIGMPMENFIRIILQ